MNANAENGHIGQPAQMAVAKCLRFGFARRHYHAGSGDLVRAGWELYLLFIEV
jgi:hypothetical protein